MYSKSISSTEREQPPTPEGAHWQGLLELLLWSGRSLRERETGKAGSLQGAQPIHMMAAQNRVCTCVWTQLPTFALLL